MNTKSLALVCCALWLWGAPATGMNFTVGNTNSVAGGAAMIPLTVAGAPTNLSAFCLFLTNAGGIGLPTVAAGPGQTNLIVFVDNFSNGIYRVTGLVTNDPPMGNGTVANLSYVISSNVASGTYPVALPAAPPANAPAGSNPEARSLATSALIASTGANGFILIAVVTPPYLTDVARLGSGTFQFAFTNASGANFSVLAATNLAQPSSNWMLVGTATQAAQGWYQFVDSAATNYPQRFYQLRWP